MADWVRCLVVFGVLVRWWLVDGMVGNLRWVMWVFYRWRMGMNDIDGGR